MACSFFSFRRLWRFDFSNVPRIQEDIEDALQAAVEREKRWALNHLNVAIMFTLKTAILGHPQLLDNHDKPKRSRYVVCFEKGQGKFGTEASAQPSLRHEAVTEHPCARQKRRLKEQNASWQSCERSSASRHSVFFQEIWLEHVGGILF